MQPILQSRDVFLYRTKLKYKDLKKLKKLLRLSDVAGVLHGLFIYYINIRELLLYGERLLNGLISFRCFPQPMAVLFRVTEAVMFFSFRLDVMAFPILFVEAMKVIREMIGVVASDANTKWQRGACQLSSLRGGRHEAARLCGGNGVSRIDYIPTLVRATDMPPRTRATHFPSFVFVSEN